MHLPVLIACPACALTSPVVFCVSLWIGGALTSHWYLKPYVSRVSILWGLPHIRAANLLSLALMLPGSIGMYSVGRQSHDLPFVALATAGLILCTVYLWLRGCWLLQQLNVTSTLRKVLFPGVLGPGMLLVGVIVGQGAAALLLVGPAWPSFAIPYFGYCAIVAAPLGALVYAGLRYVFREVVFDDQTKR